MAGEADAAREAVGVGLFWADSTRPLSSATLTRQANGGQSLQLIGSSVLLFRLRDGLIQPSDVQNRFGVSNRNECEARILCVLADNSFNGPNVSSLRLRVDCIGMHSRHVQAFKLACGVQDVMGLAGGFHDLCAVRLPSTRVHAQHVCRLGSTHLSNSFRLGNKPFSVFRDSWCVEQFAVVEHLEIFSPTRGGQWTKTVSF